MDFAELAPGMLDKALSSIVNAQGVLGCLVTDEEGTGLFSRLPSGIDASLCESAAATLYGSSQQVISWAQQGDLVSVMLEADSGKLLMSNVANLNIVVITQKDVNLGLLRVSLKKTSERLENVLSGKPVDWEKPVVAPAPVEVRPRPEARSVAAPVIEKKVVEVKPKVEEIPLPAFPDIPEGVQVPESPEERARLAFDIYKAVFLSLSIGASRVSGVVPTRGMLKRSLPQKECADFLSGVEVRNNATLDFDALKANLEKLPPERREQVLKDNFGRIIASIVNGYGSVMGYTPLKGMTRKEMNLVLQRYGEAMKKLGIIIPSEIV